jgi:very-short-patch-repair endonuclease
MKRNMFAGAGKFIFERAAELRKKQTFAEEILWKFLGTKPLGFKFRRQHAYLFYILDFYCHSAHLVIEVDGLIHEKEEVKKNDDLRQKQLEHHGLTVLRFTNDEIKIHPEAVFQKIEGYLRTKSRPRK